MNKTLLETINMDDLIINGAIFKKIQETENQPFEWLTSDMAMQLDLKLYLEHSGDKWISPYFEKLLVLEEDGDLDALSTIAKNVIMTYEDKWNKIYESLKTEYNPLENYDMEQVETPDITREKSVEVNTKMKTTSGGSTSNGIHGFNSALPVSTTESEIDSEVEVEGLADDNTSHELDTETGTRELSRHGNIGVTTSQQMLQSEIDVRSKNIFINDILDDVAKIICLSIY